MKKFGKLVALLTACVMVLSSCSMITVDKEMDDAEIVVRVGDKTVTKAEAMAEYEELFEYYSSLGLEIDANAEKELKQSVLDGLARHIVEDDKAVELGVAEFSEEEKAEAKKYAQETLEEYIEEYKVSMGDENSTEEEKLEAAKEFLASYDITEEALEEEYFHDLQHTKLTDEATKDVTVTDEKFDEAYNELLVQQTEQFKETANFEEAAANGETIVYYPSGYRAVKHILIFFSEEDQEKISTLEAELTDVELEIASMQSGTEAEVEETDVEEDEPVEVEQDQTPAAAEDATDESEQTQGSDNSEEEQIDEVPAEEAQEEEEPAASNETGEAVDAELEEEPADEAAPVTLEALTAEKERLEKEIADVKQAAQASIQSKVDEVQGKIAAGEDFDALIETYGEDPGMESDPHKTKGYYISASTTTYDKAFAQTSMALVNVGDISDSVASGFGVHIIKYIADLPEGQVDKEAVRAEMEEDLLEGLKYDTYQARLDEWVKAAGVETFIKKMD